MLPERVVARLRANQKRFGKAPYYLDAGTEAARTSRRSTP